MVPVVVYIIIRPRVIDSHQSRLDHGGGKDLSLPECSREQLEKEVRFFSIPTAYHIDERVAEPH